MVGVYLGPIVNSMVSVKEIIIRPVRDFAKLDIIVSQTETVWYSG